MPNIQQSHLEDEYGIHSCGTQRATLNLGYKQTENAYGHTS